MAEGRIGPRGSARVVGPHREGDGVLGEGVVAWAAVRLRVQETLDLLRTLLVPVPLRLPLCTCGPQQSEYIEYRRIVTALIKADSQIGLKASERK